MVRRLHVVDGTYELFRAHYAKRPRQVAPDGMEVKACAGLVASLLDLLGDAGEQVTHLAIAFDNPVESFRNELFAGYKTGDGIDPALRAQFDLAEEATAALGIVTWPMARFEADDALATAARRFADDVEQVRILSPDKDFGQCVRGRHVVQVDRARGRVFDAAGVRVRNGVDPPSIPDWLALVGDGADGIPGIPGFGARTAASLLTRYGHVDAIPDAARDWDIVIRGAERLAPVLASMRPQVRLYRTLATLVDDVPLRESLDDLCWRGADRQRFEALARRLGGLRRPPRFRD
jgi:5'-3' exonuclease